MKKTSRTFKRFAAITSASLLAACMVAPMASFAADDASIKITGISVSQAHTFEVYQVFTGDLEEKTIGEGESAKKVNILTNLKWGADVTAYSDGTTEINDVQGLTSKDVAEAVSGKLTTEQARDIIDYFTLDSTPFQTITSANGEASLANIPHGYYIIKDITNLGESNDSNSAWIVQVADTASIAIKSAQPTVDKQVWDNEDSGGWGETADWNINDKYMNGEDQQAGFRLEAKVPEDEDLAFYETYKLVFHDSMSAGVTFDGIRSVKVKVTGKDDVTITDTDYTLSDNAVANASGIDWTLTIDNLKAHLPNGITLGSAEIIVEVIYDAHLNSSAIVHNGSNGDGQLYDETVEGTKKTNVNNNTVFLEFSNNPDNFGEGDGTGQTTKDTVGVFTYEIKNTKYANTVGEGNELEGAEFKLYSDEACENEIKLEAVTKDDKIVYAPLSTGTATPMISQEDGSFNIIGLDIGTYYVKETDAPDGFNLLTQAKAITIRAAHSEVNDTTAKLDLGTQSIAYDYENKEGTSLPSTGGIGTTVFYLGGGAMVAVAGIYLISKKRMKNTQE